MTYKVDKPSINCFNKELKSCTTSDSQCVGGPDANFVYKISDSKYIHHNVFEIRQIPVFKDGNAVLEKSPFYPTVF
jgi:hypothetical protein